MAIKPHVGNYSTGPSAGASGREGSRRQSEPKDEEPTARITTQFREPANMTYELDCAGVALVLRIFFQTPEGEWRIVAQASGDRDAPALDSTALSRVEALRNIANACREAGAPGALARIDWQATERAMTRVRAL